MIHAEGKLESGDEYIRKSTGTRAMTKARKMLVEAEERGSWAVNIVPSEQHIDSRVSISYAKERFLEYLKDPKAINLAPGSLSIYRTAMRQLEEFCNERHLLFLEDVTIEHLRTHQSEWRLSPGQIPLRIGRLSRFWRYCIKNSMCSQNPANELDPPRRVAREEKMPFNEWEMKAILEAARTIKISRAPITNFELETFILVMRYSGIAISDTALLQASEIRGDEIRLFRKKTIRNPNRKLVVVPIPADVLNRLKSLPLINGRYFFCHGSVRSSSVVWHERLYPVFQKAGIQNGTSHRFRHTFATDLLTKGVRVELVSRYLGHSSIAVTQKFYSHWIEDRIQSASDVLRQLYASQ